MKMSTRRTSLFVTTFNLNGSLPSLEDVRIWLQGTSRCSASDADLVIISLQESPVAAGTTTASSTSRKGPERIEPVIFSAGMYTPSDNSTENTDGGAEFLDNIQSVLSDRHDLVADVSMGAKPNTSCDEPCGVKWHGYLRLLVYACGSEFVTELRQTSMAIAVAVGSKAMSRSNEVLSNNLSLEYSQYHALGSPDKGAVCLVMPTLKTVAVCAHLAGTNKYGVAERAFDLVRHKQLHIISRVLEDSIPNVGCVDENIDSWRIIAGDLNFRVEIHDKEEHKDRRGKDWRAVADIVQAGGQGNSCPNQQRVVELFRCHDRLMQYLEHGPIHLRANHNEDEEDDEMLALPKLLHSVVDLIQYKCFLGTNTSIRRDPQIIMPTFSFQTESDASEIIAGGGNVCKASRRPYSDKRTPSWPDRILMSRELVENGENTSSVVAVGSCPSITLSDHCPVWSYAVCSYAAEAAH